MLDIAQGNFKYLNRGVYIACSMITLSILGKVILSLVDESLSPLGKELDLSSKTINPLDKTLG